MKLPESITIGHREIALRVEDLGPDLMGQFDSSGQVISLNKNLTPVQMVETFWHELIHAINNFNRVDIEIADEMAATQMDGADPELRALLLEERMTENFAMTFVQVIQDNNLLNIKPV